MRITIELNSWYRDHRTAAMDEQIVWMMRDGLDILNRYGGQVDGHLALGDKDSGVLIATMEVKP